MTASPRHLLLKLLLGAEGSALSAREVVASCALFGMRENSVRVALVRLAAAGMIETEARGLYRLGPSAAAFADDVRTWRTAESRVRDDWAGGWVVTHAGALGRSDRAALRRRERALELLGFRELDRGLCARPDNLVGGVPRVRERLYALGLDAEAAVFGVPAFDEEREARARRLWNGKALTKSYVQTRERLEKWLLRGRALDVQAAARESFLLGDSAIRQLVYDPLLPDPLVDVEERRAFVATVLEFDRTGHAIWRKLMGLLRADGERSAAALAH
jgi:phenylacetic acid degradation operon negative regulatory protein